jgi:SPP1 family predicted phage head-tail adaptor
MAAAGSYNRRVVLQRRLDTLDVYGQRSTGWGTIGTVWARVHLMGATQTVNGITQERAIDALITIRHQPALVVDGDWRVLYGGRQYDVIGARDVMAAHTEIVLECREVRQ